MRTEMNNRDPAGPVYVEMIHYLENKVGVVDFANAQGLVMF